MFWMLGLKEFSWAKEMHLLHFRRRGGLFIIFIIIILEVLCFLVFANIKWFQRSVLVLIFILSVRRSKLVLSTRSVWDFMFLKFLTHSDKYCSSLGLKLQNRLNKEDFKRTNPSPIRVSQLKKLRVDCLCFGAPAASFSLTSPADHYTSAHIPQN